MNKLQVLGFVCLVAFVGLAGPSRKPTPKPVGGSESVTLAPPPISMASTLFLSRDEAVSYKLRWMSTFAIVRGFGRYGEVELAYPKTLAELCASPYMAVDCNSLINPYTGAKVSEGKTPGNIFIDLNGDRLSVHHYYLLGGIVKKWVSDFQDKMKLDQANKAESSKHSTVSRLPYFTVRNLSYNERLASSVGRYIEQVLSEYVEGQYQPCPRSLSDVRVWMARRDPYQDLRLTEGAMHVDHFRNGFTGSQAVQVSVPSAGNFRITCAGEIGNFKVESFGDNGRIVYSWDSANMNAALDGISAPAK
ncbi:MAG: hypothetical protein ACREJQ_07270 [bacterium]